MDINKLKLTFAAEIIGAHVLEALTNTDFAIIKDAFLAHQIIVIRDQTMSPVELLVGNGLLKQHQAGDRHAVGEAYIAALEQWAEGHGARSRVRALKQSLV